MPPETTADRRPTLFLVGGAGVAVASIALAAAAGPPYLTFASLSPWIVSFAISLFAALFAAPFVIHGRLSGKLEADARWERAVLLWGLAALGLLGVSILCGLPSGFDSGSLGGAIALVGVAEAALVLATLTLWLISN